MYKYTLFTIILLTQLLALYNVGDTISSDHQNMEFGFCYPDTLYPEEQDNIFSFAQHNGVLNGGNYQVLMIEVTASW